MAGGFTIVSGTIKDAAGNIYANARIFASFVGQSTTPGSGPYLLGGLPTGQFPTTLGEQTDSTGFFSMPLADNNQILPTPSQWNFTIVTQDGLHAFSLLTTITGATQDVTAAMAAAAAPIGTTSSFTGITVTGTALIRNLETLVSPVYDVTAYGAVGDGVTNDTAAFQAALNAAQAAHGGKVLVPMGTNAYVIATSLNMDDFFNVSLVGASQGSPAGAVPRAWLKFTGAAGPLISMKSANGCALKGLYLQYTNGAFAGNFIELGHSASARDATGNRIEDNFIGKTLTGGTATVLLSLDQCIDNIVENNQFNDAAIAIRGRNAPSGAGTDYSVNNTIRCNSFGISSGSTITTAFIQNLGEGSVIEGNDFELGGAAVAVLAYTGAMQSGGIVSGGFVGDMSGSSTMTLFTIPTNGAWVITGVVIGTVSVNVTGVVIQNNASLAFIGNKLATGTTIGTLLSVGTGDDLNVLGTRFQGAISTFLTGTPTRGLITDNNGRTLSYGGIYTNDGTALIAGMGFLGNVSIGWFRSTNNHLQVAYNAAGPWFSNLGMAIGSGMVLMGVGNADPDAAGADVGISRTAAGIWGVGTGAAGSTAGQLQLKRARYIGGTAYSGADAAIVLSAGWGTTRTVSAATGFDEGFSFTVNATGTGQAANPTITITFKDGTWTNAPQVVVIQNDNVAPTGVRLTYTITATVLTITYNNTPGAGSIYNFIVMCKGV